MEENITAIFQAMGAAAYVIVVVALALAILMIAAMWKVFTKAGQPGWAVIIPIYNNYIITKIIGKPAWWVILLSLGLVGNVVPQDIAWIFSLVGAVFTIWAWNLLVHKFGKSTGFTVGLIFLPFIFLPILGFGDAQYIGDGQVDVDSFGSKTPDVNLES